MRAQSRHTTRSRHPLHRDWGLNPGRGSRLGSVLAGTGRVAGGAGSGVTGVTCTKAHPASSFPSTVPATPRPMTPETAFWPCSSSSQLWLVETWRLPALWAVQVPRIGSSWGPNAPTTQRLPSVRWGIATEKARGEHGHLGPRGSPQTPGAAQRVCHQGEQQGPLPAPSDQPAERRPHPVQSPLFPRLSTAQSRSGLVFTPEPPHWQPETLGILFSVNPC